MEESKDKEVFSRKVGENEKRKLASRAEKKRSEWQGFGLFGIVGWSVAVPTLLGTALGKWIDSQTSGTISWTLSFLIIGLVIGCIIAAYWIRKEHKEMHQDKNKEDE